MTEEESSCKKKSATNTSGQFYIFLNSKRGQEDPGGASFIKHGGYKLQGDLLHNSP
jgi:hypothetical protein